MSKKIEKQNKQIAEVMDNFHEGNVIQNPEYHVSWDWLMPVIDKILALENTDFDMTITLGGMCSLRVRPQPGSTRGYEILICEEYKDISTAYKTVLEFIKWYKKQKKKEGQ